MFQNNRVAVRRLGRVCWHAAMNDWTDMNNWGRPEVWGSRDVIKNVMGGQMVEMQTIVRTSAFTQRETGKPGEGFELTYFKSGPDLF